MSNTYYYLYKLKTVDMIPDRLHISFGDVHLYKNHIEQAHELLSRNLHEFKLPKLVIDRKYHSIDDFHIGSYDLQKYSYHPTIKAPISV